MFQVAIDGPGGAGKSTISRAAAKEMGFVYIDTGAMYRAAALFCFRQGIDIKKDPAAAEKAVGTISVDIAYLADGQHIFLNGEDVSEAIRTPAVSMGASDVSAIPAVRVKMVELQRALASSNNVIMDGRDIGTHVLPEAQVKIFLTASAEVRAERRFSELTTKGQAVNYEDVLAEMKQRDRNDETRAVSPLRPAEDSIRIDTSSLSFADAVQAVIGLIREKYEEKEGV